MISKKEDALMRLHETARPHRANVAQLRDDFYNAPDDALLDRKTVAAGLNRSVSWLEKFATHGGGPTLLKVGNKSVLYRKRDVVRWFEGYVRRMNSTSQLASSVTVHASAQ